MLKNKERLLYKKNLLAFSAGVDSSALLFLLLENNISFDIAIVDYGIRAQSKKELIYAKELAKKHGFTCHTLAAPNIEKNFEANARALRYEFFEQLIEKYAYENLLTAHHLGDRLEWMLMQFCKGAGALELAGMQESEKRQNYQLLRPLLHLEKKELLHYLETHSHRYFIDESNSDEKYKRNEFRHKYAQPLLEKYKEGIKRSFEYLDEDREQLLQKTQLHHIKECSYFVSKNMRSDMYYIDKHFKSLGILLGSYEKALLKRKRCLLVHREWLVSFNTTLILITPYIEGIKMQKQFKERMRKFRIEPKQRPYFYLNPDVFTHIEELL